MISCLTVKDQCGLVGGGFDPIKVHTRTTMQLMRAISDAIDAREPTVFMVEKARSSLLLDAAKLLPAILTSSSFVGCVEYMF